MDPIELVVLLSILLLILIIWLHVYFLWYIDQLKSIGCECAFGWKRTFIEIALIVIIASQTWSLFSAQIPRGVRMFVGLMTLIYIIVTRMFINQVKHDACDCAMASPFYWMNLYNWIQIAFLIIVFILAMAKAVSG